MVALEQVGIFDPLIMQAHLLGAMRRVEERDRERFSQPPNE
jgi:hypothetical protein